MNVFRGQRSSFGGRLTRISSAHQTHKAVVIQIAVPLQNGPLEGVQTCALLQLWSARKINKFLLKVGKVGESVCSLGARKPTSEAELRDPGSSHLDWLYRSFMMRNKVTSSKCVLIFPAPPVGDNYFIGVGKTSLNIACLFIYFFFLFMEESFVLNAQKPVRNWCVKARGVRHTL